MRVVQNPQMQIGEVDISQIRFDPKSRDDIPKILRGLQHLYMDIPLRAQIFQLLEAEISPKVSKSNGRPGMELWKILVCGVVRLDLNEDCVLLPVFLESSSRQNPPEAPLLLRGWGFRSNTNYVNTPYRKY